MFIDLPTIRRMSEEIREALGDDHDEATFLDTLDGETDAADIADKLLADMLGAEAMGEAIRVEIADLTARRNRFDARGDAIRVQLLALLDAMGEKKLERPRATISRRAGMASVQIIEESAIPSQLCKTTVAPDRAAIKAQLQAGEAVPGAALVMGKESLSVRVK
jgi:hypothetical protein